MSTNQNEPTGGIRIGDAERNEAVNRLGAHYEAGRLSADEHSERVDQALRATTRGDLDALFTDLPGEGAGPQWPGAAAGQGGAGWQGPPWARQWFGGPAQDGSGTPQGPGTPQDGPRPGGPYGSGAPFAGPPWARGGWRGPRVFGLPVPLVAVLAFLTLAGLACAVLGGHPPVLLFVVAGIATVAILKRRRFGSYRA
jgi:hypothetical protein